MPAVIRCKACGAPLEFAPGEKVCICKYCQSPNTLVIPDNVEISNKANELRNRCKFDRAIRYYEDLIEQDPRDAEGYFGLTLCKYGIEYVQDPYSGKRIPTCRRLQMIPMAQDEDYKKAIRYADDEVRQVYEEECVKIDKILARARILAANGEKFDVFISYKESEEDGSRTEASVIAQDLYERLTSQGYRVFFSRKTLEDMAGLEYEPVIYSALHSAKVLLLLGTKPEQFRAVWVKNEWSRYLARMNGEPDCRLIPLYKDMSPEELPDEVKNFQAIDMNHIGFEQDITDAVGRLVRKRKASGDGEAISLENIRRMGYTEAEKGDFSKAKQLFDQALLHAPKDWESYLGKVLCTAEKHTVEELLNCVPPVDFRSNGDYKMAKRFAPEQQRKEMEQWDRQMSVRLEHYGKQLCDEGEKWLSAGEFSEAVGSFKKALKYTPDSYRAKKGCYLGRHQYRSLEDMAKTEELPGENKDFQQAMEVASPDERKELEQVITRIKENIRQHQNRDIAVSWRKVLVLPAAFTLGYVIYCIIPIPSQWLITTLLDAVSDSSGSSNPMVLLITIVAILAHVAVFWGLPLWIVWKSSPTIYEKGTKIRIFDGSWKEARKKRINLPGSGFRMLIHIFVSIAMLAVCYLNAVSALEKIFG